MKPLVAGHWGTTPGQNFIYVHLNRAITKYDLDMFYVAGPGHGGPALVANTYLEGSYSEIYPDVSQDEAGMKKLFTQFSFPGGISSHVAPTTPGSIHEGGELGYSLSHAFGAAFDNPGLIVACVIGDGEAETGPLATAWQSTKFLNPIADGAVLPILHLNGYKISNPTVLARIEPQELDQFLRGCGWEPRYVEGDDPEDMHELMATVLDETVEAIRAVQHYARTTGDSTRPRWPMIVLRSPKGWTGPKFVDGVKIEGTFRAHQVPLLVDEAHPGHVELLDAWMRSYKPDELFDRPGVCCPTWPRWPHSASGGWAPTRTRTPGWSVIWRCPTTAPKRSLWPPRARWRQKTPACSAPSCVTSFPLNDEEYNFRLFGPDETLSNMLGAVFEVTDRQWEARTVDTDEDLATQGRVLDSMLSEHQCQGVAGRLPTHRTARAVQLLRGVHPHRRLDVQPARQMAQGDCGTTMAPRHRLAELPAGLPRVAAGPQRLHPPGPRLPGPRREQESRHRAGVSAAGRQLPALGGRSLPAQPPLRQRDRRRQTPDAAVAEHRASRGALHRRHRYLGLGWQRRRCRP